MYKCESYLLPRDAPATEGNNGRACLRRGTSDLPRRSFLFEEGRFGHQPDEIDHAELFEDVSGNFGRAYRSPEEPNAIMWSQNLDTRFPRQMVHCQQLQVLLMAQYSGSNINCEYIIDDLPLASGQPPGNGTVLAVGRGFVTSFTPTYITNTVASMFDVKREATAEQFYGRPALCS